MTRERQAEDMRTSSISNVKLKWAFVDGHIRDVSDFAHLDPASRPQAHCPVCERPVVMKLGDIRAHHCAHQPGDECAATAPETALHLNMKYYVACQLRQTNQLSVRQRCQGAYCRNEQIVIWKQGWDEVAVEFKVGTYRPDVALLSQGQEIAAIEIHVTNIVGEEKIEFLRSRGLSIIEICGDVGFYLGDYAWTYDQPLPYERLFPVLTGWICSDCRRKREEDQRRKLAADHVEHYNTYGHCSRIVDFYYPSGKKYRGWYFISVVMQNGRVVAAQLNSWSQPEPLAVIEGEITKETIQELKKPFDRHVQSSRPPGTIIDRHMKWQFREKGTRFYPGDTERFPFRYELAEDGKTWIQVIAQEWFG